MWNKSSISSQSFASRNWHQKTCKQIEQTSDSEKSYREKHKQQNHTKTAQLSNVINSVWWTNGIEYSGKTFLRWLD